MTIHNNMCDGSHCSCTDGEVRLYPLGGDANLILCKSCWMHENNYRRQRARETRNDQAWPLNDWIDAKTYGE